jgi:hypothetical protein
MKQSGLRISSSHKYKKDKNSGSRRSTRRGLSAKLYTGRFVEKSTIKKGQFLGRTVGLFCYLTPGTSGEVRSFMGLGKIHRQRAHIATKKTGSVIRNSLGISLQDIRRAHKAIESVKSGKK